MVLKEDFINIREYRLDQLLDEDDTILENAIIEAESIVNDHLYQYYNVAAIFSATGTNRSMTVVNWVKHLALYIIYERAPDNSVPDRIVKNYDDTREILLKVAEGKMSLSLPVKINTTTGEKKTKFRGAGESNRKNTL